MLPLGCAAAPLVSASHSSGSKLPRHGTHLFSGLLSIFPSTVPLLRLCNVSLGVVGFPKLADEPVGARA
ncbi:hypothetical protein CEQ51_12735 [Pseudomonas thivervalensis]|uniref:Uncharacterized protein n=1 Tax=Pseudomonas thivervalensis TaxID=86265 RepID=A0A2Z4ZTH1_9PSED|nr:hypothetical protein CE140_12860 [Pseudomonas thivervalensis]AXA60896.1 hypothetical protein CEQ51_12735 [Pseudomonas thivervalensis]